VSLYHFKVLLASFAVAAIGGIAGGLIFAWLGDRSPAYGIGTGLFFISLICLGLGLLGATEPPGGWSARRRGQGRKSLIARIASDQPEVEGVSSMELFVWGLFVGGGLMAASFFAYALAAR
jgi:MFS family permease